MTEGEMMAVGVRAQALLDDEVFVASLSVVAAGCVEAWKASGTVEEREAAHARLVALNAVAAELRGIASQGRRIAAEIERRRTERKTER